MNEMDPRLKKLKNELHKTQIEKPINNDLVLNLWPSYTLQDILMNPLFYEKPITQPKIMTLDELYDSLIIENVPQEIINNMVLVNVDYRGFDNKIFHGQIIIHKDLEVSIKKVFKRILLETDYPMTSVFPISMFNWNTSSRLNNCGAFDWRFVKNTYEISDHSFGSSIDINPVLNPWVQEGELNSPNFPYDPSQRGTLHSNSDVVKIFKEEGWKWGGDWEKSKDWMHFYRPEISYRYYGKIDLLID